ncbi:hypothetical protein [Anaeromyxobacter oryzae]|uniref:Lipoprotein n=1 Tax=Anaeromyxobacter oryzae TaxID=2918170 RepID=A0ABM7WP17_9BACT|nr:hypothetical protein [Anaeromyxobacter oryzae]BDG01212.1 hypothetical protein AMOR_02080 [Anaeromyxobacter oryzae]
MRTIPLSFSLTLALGVAACSGDRHLSAHHSESYVKAFSAQAQRTGQPAAAVSGLDAQEAAITTDNYRSTLVPKNGRVNVTPEPYVIVAPPSREQPMRPAPSVPRE